MIKKQGMDMGTMLSADKLWRVAWTYIQTVVDTLREPFLILDENLRVISANKTFYNIFEVKEQETAGKKVYDLGNGQWNIPKLRTLLEDIIPKNTFFKDFKIEHDFPKIGEKIMILNGRQIHTTGDERRIMLLAMEDVTEQKKLESQLITHTKELSLKVSQRTAELEIQIHELKRLNKVMVGREIKMIELKGELEKIKNN